MTLSPFSGAIMSERVCLLIVDAECLFRQCLSTVLATDPEFNVLGPVDLTGDAFEKVAQHAPDIVLLSLDSPNKFALELTSQITHGLPQVKVLILGLLEE